MPLYNFKSIQPVPTASDFIDIILSKTQRQTPTVVHNGWAIQRIRQFYMRKVKYTQSNWNDRLTAILTEFPKVDEVHPFYADLMNVLYDKDHYKLALGQLHTAKNLMDKVAQDYVRLLKYGDSLYRCKQLKRAALGRMCTLMKRQAPSLAYLEQVRQHLSRLPSIDPNTRTLLVCGYPNVGKSSFMNKVTRADVEVQPYAFTTKSLFVGHTDYKYLRWQVIDTPGILDRPLEERNTIEMQSITALAHLRAAVLYVVDISEQCGFTLEQQATLFHSISPLFANKPVMIVMNKIDAKSVDELSSEQREVLDKMANEAAKVSAGAAAGAAFTADMSDILVPMSTLTEEGVSHVKTVACDRLLASRVEVKLKSKRVHDVADRLHVAMPKQRDAVSRPPCIPSGVEEARMRRDAGERKKTEKDLQEELGGAGVYSQDVRKRWDLAKEEWKYDVMPEIWDGHNVADFIDPDIDAKLEALEREEEEQAANAPAMDAMEEEHLTPEEAETLAAIRSRKAKLVSEHRRKRKTGTNAAIVPRLADTERSRTAARMKDELSSMGLDPTAAINRARSQSRGRELRKKRARSQSASVANVADGTEVRVRSSKSRSMSRGRALSLAEPEPGKGIKDVIQRNKAIKMNDRAQKRIGRMARKGEGDRHIPDLKPKHLFSGKRPKGTADRR
uniref:Nucleolar GTP-binding protein 1 n=1 Tax=Picochlorum oklahomense TaxID=249345 RepID=A0A6T5WPN0_9CHLO|mmetsp:Transcript_1039/g.2154  ORF Transcript_1039/g.2154 Transcript_1039/m.2154 type:complete len:674 (+) Transcript_1039:221-2242(+)|eukprot:CAMPEP_0118807726 /NCGR_PEP_ID=MMETSP1161-20130426/35621_1 /TAXON_ID=249345 /ORGANISM="Picochlorum oklahomensis, Strain CCMP2329" /LENGTH=673 /DNA_ID=CAMNT_0006737107 /DNA_START=153 /DNA_END=2174 /DNA_ORIENTATION=-